MLLRADQRLAAKLLSTGTPQTKTASLRTCPWNSSSALQVLSKGNANLANYARDPTHKPITLPPMPLRILQIR